MTIAGLTSFSRAGLVALAFGLGGCAATMAEGPQRANMLRATALDLNDPLEPFNRSVLNLNVAIYNTVERPIAGIYVAVVPGTIREKLSAGVNNLDEPRIFINNLLQLRGEAAYKTFGRFLINSTLGLGGIVDVATEGGLKRQTGDFGQTLYVWGVSSGPYLVLPLIGPSNFRDAVGTGVDAIGDPASYAIGRVGGPWSTVGVGAFSKFNRAGEFDDVLAGSIDPYPRLRSIYLQKRASELGDAVGITINPQTEPTPVVVAPQAVTKKRRR